MLYHHGYNEKKAALETRNVRATHDLTRNLATTLQVWSWDEEEGLPEGDAIIVMASHDSGYAVMRLGEKVGVYDCSHGGIRGVMERAGLPYPKLESEADRLFRRAEEMEHKVVELRDITNQLVGREDRLVKLLVRARDLLSDSGSHTCQMLVDEIDEAVREDPIPGNGGL